MSMQKFPVIRSNTVNVTSLSWKLVWERNRHINLVEDRPSLTSFVRVRFKVMWQRTKPKIHHQSSGVTQTRPGDWAMCMRFWGEITREIGRAVGQRCLSRACHPKARSHDPITRPDTVTQSTHSRKHLPAFQQLTQSVGGHEAKRIARLIATTRARPARAP